MKGWKNTAYYLGTTLLAAGLIYVSQLAHLYYQALWRTSFDSLYQQLVFLSPIGGAFAVGFLLGVETLFRQRDTVGGWKFNYSKALLVGLPALLGSLWFILTFYGLPIKLELVVLLTRYDLILSLIAGWALGGSFYKEIPQSVPLQIGCSDD